MASPLARQLLSSVTAKMITYDYQTIEEVLGAFGEDVIDDTDLESVMIKAISAVRSALGASFVTIVSCERIITVGTSSQHAEEIEEMVRSVSRELEAATRKTSIVHPRRTTKMQTRIMEVLGQKRVQVIARLTRGQPSLGFIFVGKKRGAGNYTASELLFLRALADEASLAISNVNRFVEIQEFNDRLTNEVNQATSEIRAQNKKLQELDQVKNEFISMASHQLRTPLTSVKGYISMVLEGDAGKVTPMQKKLLEEAFTSSERMVHLIGDFLNVSRLQSGKFMLETHETNLAEVIKQEVDGMRQIARSHGVTISYRQPNIFPTLVVDEGKLRQVMMNFIDNAIFYSPDNTSVTVSANVEDGMAVVRVIDHGMGVPKSAQKKLFSKFFRAENARLQRPDGTGVGLYLAKRIIDEHGGSIIFESKEGKGSTFGFRLPIMPLTKP